MKKCCSCSLLIPILYLARMHQANYSASIFKTSLFFKAMIPCLNCLPLPDLAAVKLHWERKWHHLLTSLFLQCVNPADYYAAQAFRSNFLFSIPNLLGSHSKKLNWWAYDIIFALNPVLSMQLDWSQIW